MNIFCYYKFDHRRFPQSWHRTLGVNGLKIAPSVIPKEKILASGFRSRRHREVNITFGKTRSTYVGAAEAFDHRGPTFDGASDEPVADFRRLPVIPEAGAISETTHRRGLGTVAFDRAARSE